MASFGEGFASGMGQGMAMGKMLMDTYNEYDQKDKLKKAGELDQEEIAAGFTPHQQMTIDHVSKPENGFQIEKMENGGVRFRSADSENSWTELAPEGKKFKLGGKTQDTAFTQDQIDRHRANAQAQVLIDAGDVKGGYGLRSMAREDRSGRQLEEVKDWKMNMLQNIAQGNYDPVLQELMPYYNKPGAGSKFDDGHHATVVGNNVVFSNDKGIPVAQHPINGKTLSEALNMAFEDKMSALDPKFGLDARKVKAAETSARADVEYKGTGGVAERVGMAGVRARENSGGGGKPNVRLSTYTDDNGVKVPMSVVTTFKNGVPSVQAFNMRGKPITDEKALSQAAGEEGGLSTTGRNNDLGAARKAFELGNMDYNTYQNTVTQINQTHDRKDTMYKLGNDFKSAEKDQGREAAVRSVVAQIEGSVKNPKDKEVVYGQLGIKPDEILVAKRDKKGTADLKGATNYSPQSTWQPGQRRIPENMRGQ